MTIFLGILLALIVFFVVVLIHEWGHFAAARLVGMRVLEFGLGIPPKIKKIFTDKKGTDFTLNALPIGGFVRIDGENIESPKAFDSGTFMSKSWPKRVFVLVAGVVMNLILAWVIFFSLFIIGTKPLAPIPLDIGPTNSYFLPSFDEAMKSGFITSSGAIVEPLTGSLAAKSGIQSNDIIIKMNGNSIQNSNDLSNIVRQNIPLKIDILRNNKPVQIAITPENGKIGVRVGDAIAKNENFTSKFSVIEGASMATKEVYYSSILTFSILKKTFTGLFFSKNQNEHEIAKQNLSGPIGAGKAFVKMVEWHIPASMILLFVALLSINLAVMNILPFPALDGGRIVTTTIYSILATIGFTKTKILKVESKITTFGFILLMIFMIYVAGLDISRFF